MAKWWPEPGDTGLAQGSSIAPSGPGGAGENFGVVVFDTDGGTPQPKALKISWDSVVGRLRPISRGSDAFIRWVDEKGLPWNVETREVKKADDVDGDGFISLKAVWQDYTGGVYIVSFETYPDPIPIPASPSIISPQSVTTTNGLAIQPVNPMPLDDGRAFAGWYTEPESIYRWKFDEPVTHDMTLYAKWVNDTYTVTFVTNGGTRPDGSPLTRLEIKVPVNDCVQDPGPLVVEGYSFAGWFTEQEFIHRWNFDLPVAIDITLYAKWEKSTYFVNFVITPSPAETPATQQIIHGGYAVQPASPPQLGDGRAFGGWYFVNGDSSAGGWQDQYLWDFSKPVLSSMTLYARWMAQTRTVSFQVNGGKTSGGQEFIPNATIPIVSGKIINPGSLNRTGYCFGGWYTDPACIVPWNFSADRVTQPDAVIGMDPMYLYAKWTPNVYIVRFNANGGTPAPATQNVAYGEMVKIPPIMSKATFAFSGWFTDPACTVAWNFDKGVTSNMDLYAGWDTIIYTVRFNLGNANGAAPHSVYSGFASWPVEQHVTSNGVVAEIFMPSLPESSIATAWSFYSWCYSNDPTDTADTSITTGNITQRDNKLRSNGKDNVWDFTKPVSTVDTSLLFEKSPSNYVVNLYARWVGPPPEMDMVWVPRGSFIMGDSGVSGATAACHAYPARRVTLDGFFIGKYEIVQVRQVGKVTNKSYVEVKELKGLNNYNPSQFYKNDARPVERVSWYDAVQFCNDLTDLEMPGHEVYTITGPTKGSNLAGTGGSGVNSRPAVQSIISANVSADFTKRGYRLPTEAEWEYAARGGNNSPGNFTYSGSNDARSVAWYNESIKESADAGSTQTVGTRQDNALGICDMSGNISEWVWDWFASYNDSYYKTSAAGVNPTGPDSGTERVRRGGAWSNAVGNVRNVVRNSDTPSTANWVIGFRVVRGPSVIW